MGLTHYGDWQAQFEAGTLVYYEVYSDGSYGFRGANKSTVKTTGTVAGDGYGMVYSTLPEQDLTVRYSLGGREVTSTLYRANAIDMGRGTTCCPAPDTGEHHRGIHGLLPPGAGGGHHLLPIPISPAGYRRAPRPRRPPARSASARPGS